MIKNFSISPSVYRQTDCVLALGGIMIWLLNGLYHCPQDSFQSLAEEACQHIPIDYYTYDEALNEGENTVPLMFDAGLYFVCDIVIDASGIYCIPFHKQFSNEAILSAFRIDLQNLRQIIEVPTLNLARRGTNPERTSNHSKCCTLNADDICPYGRDLPHIDEHRLANIQVRPHRRMRGEDVTHFEMHGGGSHNPDDCACNMDQPHNLILRARNLMEQFFFDIIEESLNKKSVSEGAWTNIPKDL